jgi:hypothetical protein
MVHEPVTISTFADLIAKGYRLTFFCDACHRNEPVDLAAMPQDAHYWGRTWRCRCGEKGAVTLNKITLAGGKAP